MPLPERGPSARSAGGLHRQGWARPIFSEASLLRVTHDGVVDDLRLPGGHEASTSDGVLDRSLGLAYLHGDPCG
jgi:hypothetical protein